MLYIIILLILILLISYWVVKKEINLFEFLYYKKFIVFIPIFVVSVIAFVVSALPNDSQSTHLKEIPSRNFLQTEVKNIAYNKVVIVGDSRMENISFNEDDLNIPINFIFDAKGRATIDWFKETGIVKLKDILENKDRNYHYHVVINMGVNDIQYAYDIKDRVKEYFLLYKNLYLTYSEVDFYILSVNPVDDKILSKDKNSRRTNKRIEEFNGYVSDSVMNSDANNIYYCNSYDKIDFNLPDGLHYDDETNQKIIEYITNRCVNYK